MKERLIKVLLIIAGTISIILGIIGIFLPILPTTPLFLLGAGCYARSSKTFYLMLINNKIFGKYIRNYREHKVITNKSKVVVLSLLWITMSYSIYYMTTKDMPSFVVIGVIILLLGIATWITQHVLRLNSIIDESKIIISDDILEAIKDDPKKI